MSEIPSADSQRDFTKSSMIQLFQFSDGLAVAYTGQKRGYIDKTGKFVIEPEYDSCEQFREGIAIVSKDFRNMTMDCLDRTGKVIGHLPTGNRTYGNGLCARQIDKAQYEYVDKSGNRAFPKVFGAAMVFSEGLAAAVPHVMAQVDENHSWGYIDLHGNCAIPPNFYISGNNLASAFIDGRATVEQLSYDRYGNTHNLHHVIDKTGRPITPAIYESISAYREGLALARRNQTWLFLDRNGNEVIRPAASWVNSFSDGMAAVQN